MAHPRAAPELQNVNRAFDESSAWMSSSARALSHPGWRRVRFFPPEKSAKKKNLSQLHLQHQSEIKKLLNLVLGESLEDLHCAELECQLFARRKTLLNSVLGVDLEDLHAPLPPPRPKAGVSTICSAVSCWSEE